MREEIKETLGPLPPVLSMFYNTSVSINFHSLKKLHFTRATIGF